MTLLSHLRETWVPALVLAVLLAGCGAGRNDPLPLEEQFDNPQSGWGSELTGAFDREYDSGRYSITVRRQNWFVWAQPGHAYEDVVIEAEVNAGAGSETGLAGLLCRQRSLGNFYFFAVTSDGYYAIFRRVDGGALEPLTGAGALTFSAAIDQGDAVNHLRVICQGDELSLSVNGLPVASATDASHRRGDIGVGVASGPAGQARAEFDSVSVRVP